VILEAELDQVISVLGQPEDYAEVNDESGPQEPVRQAEGAEPRRLFRDSEEGMFAGVCSGIGYYFGMDPVWLRIAFLVAFFFGGSGLILYLILWIAMPKAVTRSEKLQMRGHPVNLETLEKGFKEEMDRLNRKAEEVGKKAGIRFRGVGFGTRLGNFLTELFQSIGKVLVNVFAWLGRFIGFAFLMAGTFGFFIWLMLILGFGDAISLNGDPLATNSIASFFDLVFSKPWQSFLFTIGLALLVVAPILGVLFAGIRLIFPKKFSYRWPGAFSAGLFIIGMITCIVCGAFVIRDFRSQGKVIQSVPLHSFSTDTIHVISNPGAAISLKRSVNLDGWQVYYNDDDEFMMGRARLKIERADVEKPILQVVSKAHGLNKRLAAETAENLRYFVKQRGDTLFFNPWFRLKEGSRWRGQEVEFRFKVPDKTHFRFDEEMIWQVNDLYVPIEREGLNPYNWIWKTDADKMTCLNCPETE
jgi:phage shock protein PspC (stress-responsive transcriptional regulator)